MQWFDAHLDLAYLAVNGRDMHAQPESAGGPDLPAAITLPSLRHGNIRACLATIFTELDGTDRSSYPAGDAAAAHRAGLAQLDVYKQWEQRGDAELRLKGTAPLNIGILVEGADPISGPDELAWWTEQGVIAVGLAWAKGSRYSGGNTNAEGLTPLGRDMVEEMDRLDVTHDLSHLNDKSFWEVMELSHGAVMASHSNCRALIDLPGQPPNQRHLTDDMIRAIAQREGLIGLNLYSSFLIPGGSRDQRATIQQSADHIEHVCSVVGHRRSVGLGSDMDGGFSADRLPQDLNRPADLPSIAQELRRRSWSDADIEGFAWGNWARFWGIP